EYPFAIIAADLYNGMKVADVGCGNSPFTAYLSNKLGSNNVYGYDPDVLKDDDVGHSHFSAKLSFIQDIGINFYRDDITSLTAESDFFDVIFCISVLEHIDNALQKANGIKEMVRILRPGGKLILT
ncbi:MAG: class I SAM-dependent methyltransferase, partial [Pirellulaceae bacterium]